MPRSILVMASLSSFALIGGCAPPPGAQAVAMAQPNGRQCFLASQVNSFSATKDGNVDIRAGASRYFKLTLGGGCPSINFSTQVGIRTTGGGSWICEGYDAELIVPDPAFNQRCPIANVQAISRQQFFAEQKH